MLSLRDFWSRHRRKVFVALGVFGSGYVIYKLYDDHRRRISDLDKQLEGERQVDELIKAQYGFFGSKNFKVQLLLKYPNLKIQYFFHLIGRLQTHFENIQRISDTTTLPYAMQYLRSRILEELDLSHLTHKLMQGKGQSNALTSKEKLELWEGLKILSFTRIGSSLWSMTMLYLYVRAQVNILGRHLYLEISHGSESYQLLVNVLSFTN